METLSTEQRHVSMAIRACSHEQYRHFCTRIDALRQEFLELDETGDNDRVLALNVQLFPVMLADNTHGEPRDDDV
jgi:hypothetical protein